MLKSSLLLWLTLLAFSAARAQTDKQGYAPKVNSQGNLYNQLRTDSAQHIPHKYGQTLNTTDTTPQIYVWTTPSGDSLVIFVNGRHIVVGAGQNVANAGGALSMQSGTYAGLPLAGIAGRFYAATDSAFWLFDNGSVWINLSGSGGGGGPGTVVSAKSVTGDGSSGSPLQLVNDALTPGNLKYYGTDASGVKGYNQLGTAAFVDKPVSGNASGTQVVMGNDSRLTDARNANALQGKPISGTAPTSGQVLQYDGTDYVPATPSGGSQTLPQVLATGRTLSHADSVLLAGHGLYFKGSYTEHDSIFLTVGYTNPIIGVDSVVTFGTSITAGLNSTSADSSYAGRFAHFFSLHLTNLGVSSSLSTTMITSNNRYINPGHRAIVTGEAGFNDLRVYGATCYDMVITAYNDVMINQWLSSYIGASDVGVTLYGAGWSVGWDANTNAGGKSHNGAFTGAQHDSLVTTTAAGTTIAVGLVGQSAAGSGALVDIYVDNVLKKSVDLSSASVDGGYRPVCAYVTGLSNTTHVVKLVNNDGVGLMICDYVGVMGASPRMPFVAMGVPYQVYGGAAAGSNTKVLTDTLNNRIRALVAQFVADGFPGYMADLASYYPGTPPDISGDDIHPSNHGHDDMAKAAEAALVSPASNGIIQYGNDHRYYGDGKPLAYANVIGIQDVINNNANINAPSVINGNSFSLNFANFSTVTAGITTLTQTTADVHGQLGTTGPAASVVYGYRDGDTTQGFIRYATSGIFHQYNSEIASDELQSDTGYHNFFMNDPYIHGSADKFGAIVDVMGNQRGLQKHAPLRIGAGTLMATPEPNVVENDTIHLYWTDAAGTRYQLDQQGGGVTQTALDDTAAAIRADFPVSSSPPFDANTAILKDHTDPTKTLKVALSSITTGTARTLTVPNTSLTIAGIDISQTFSGHQTFSIIEPSTLLSNGHYKSFAHVVSSLGTTYSIALTDNLIGVDASTANVTLTLPSASIGSGRIISGSSYGIEYVIYKEDNSSNTVTVVVNNTGTETINGSTSFVISSQYTAFHVVCTTGGAINWFKY